MDATAPHRRWFRFSLRTLFVLMTVLGAGLGWLGVQLKWIRDRHQALEKWDNDQHVVNAYEPLSDVEAPWSLRLFGEFGVDGITVEQNQVSEYQKLFPEAEVAVRKRQHSWP